jgi:hypothetical protein
MSDDARTAERVRRVAAELADRRPGDHSIRTELLERAVDAVDRISHAVDDQTLREAVKAGTDTAFLAALSRLAIPASDTVGQTDPLAIARARGEQAKRDIVAAQGDTLDAAQVATRLGWDLAKVEDRRQDGLLLALPVAPGELRFPAWQFTGGGLLPGLEDVLRVLPAPDPWSRVTFFTDGDPFLGGRTPLELLQGGEIEPVRRLAAAYDELVAT